MRKQSLFAMAAGLVLALASQGAEAAEKLKIGFLPGVVDPFYQVMQIGVAAAAKDLGVEVVTQVPPTGGVDVQTPILDSMVARGDLNYIITAHRGRVVAEKVTAETNTEELIQYMVGARDDTNNAFTSPQRETPLKLDAPPAPTPFSTA